MMDVIRLTSPTHIVRLVPDTPFRVFNPLSDLLPFTPHTLTSTPGILTLPTPVPHSVEEDWYSTNTPGLQGTVVTPAILLRSSHVHFGLCLFIMVRRYIITCLCPNLVSVPFYAIPIFPFKFPKFFIYLSPIIFSGPRYMHFAIFVALWLNHWLASSFGLLI